MSYQLGTRKRVGSAKPIAISQHRTLPGPGMYNSQESSPPGIYLNKGSGRPMRIQSANVNNNQRQGARYQINDQQRVQQSRPLHLRANQQMTEEIISLKLTIKGLMQELTHQKGKVEVLRKKGRESGKALEWQIERQEGKGVGKCAEGVHWKSGMRHAYTQLKQKYQAKCKEMDQLVRLSSSSNLMEQHVFKQIMQEQMQQLKFQHQKLLEARKSISIVTQASQQAVEVTIADLTRDKQRLALKCQMVLRKYDSEVDLREELQHRLESLEKMYLEKDNQVHMLSRKLKVRDRQIESLRDILKQGRTERKNMAEKGQIKDDEHKTTLQKIILDHKHDRAEWQLSLQVKMRESDREYARLNDANRQLKQANQGLRRTISEMREQILMLKRQSLNPQKVQLPTTIDLPQETQHQDEDHHILMQNGHRIPRRAGKRYSEAAKKKRKVSKSQIMNAAQFIRLKCIAGHISHKALKSYFQSGKEVEDLEWAKEYMTMGETKNILMEAPFALQQSEAELMARYLIEDSNEDYVYRDQLNQNHRQVVKSIMINLLNTYHEMTVQSKEEKLCDQLVQKYGYNLAQTLEQVCPKGLITKQKLLETMIGIGIDATEEVLDVFMGRIALQSQNIHRLCYKKVLE